MELLNDKQVLYFSTKLYNNNSNLQLFNINVCLLWPLSNGSKIAEKEIYAQLTYLPQSVILKIQVKFYLILWKGQDCGEPPKINNTQRFGSVTEGVYRCNECYIGGGSATCRNGEWNLSGSCEREKSIFEKKHALKIMKRTIATKEIYSRNLFSIHFCSYTV